MSFEDLPEEIILFYTFSFKWYKRCNSRFSY